MGKKKKQIFLEEDCPALKENHIFFNYVDNITFTI